VIPRIALIGGQGYPLTETPAGLPTLKARLDANGVDTGAGPFSHMDRQRIRDWLHGYQGFRGLIGDSLGAGASAIYAGDLDGEVDFIGGFQPSAWDPVGQGPINDRIIIVAKNVKIAHCIWDPVFVDTAGLGNAHFVTATGSKTILTLTEHRGAHPDDWGYAQNLMFVHVIQVVGSGAYHDLHERAASVADHIRRHKRGK
jgi:hypothetical protein